MIRAIKNPDLFIVSYLNDQEQIADIRSINDRSFLSISVVVAQYWPIAESARKLYA